MESISWRKLSFFERQPSGCLLMQNYNEYLFCAVDGRFFCINRPRHDVPPISFAGGAANSKGKAGN
ncbi:MAG TPA: hypothetical protein DEQ84_07510 [Prevotellaceae bacterium]|nr:hypothetical protein [Prevotellaceae bacterium]